MGIPKELFIEEESTLDEFTCPICIEIIAHPVRLGTCIHHFCMTCIEEWFDHQESNGHPLICPLCRIEANVEYKYVQVVSGSGPNEEELGEERVRILLTDYPTDEFKNQLGNLNLKCVNAANGCNEILKYKFAKQHQSQCQFKQ